MPVESFMTWLFSKTWKLIAFLRWKQQENRQQLMQVTSLVCISCHASIMSRIDSFGSYTTLWQVDCGENLSEVSFISLLLILVVFSGTPTGVKVPVVAVFVTRKERKHRTFWFESCNDALSTARTAAAVSLLGFLLYRADGLTSSVNDCGMDLSRSVAL